MTSSLSTNSTSYVPTSSAVYSLKSTMDTLSSEIQSMQDRMNPNNRYESKNLGTWSSVSDVDTFLSRFNHDNLYKDGDTELAVGNTISFNVLSSPVKWYIAGFDLEHNQTAADGTTYDNGYGICLIPVSYINSNATTYHDNISTLNGYISSDMHTKKIPYYVPDLNKILGSHLVQRNVLLSSSKDNSTGHSNGYTWTTAYGTLMSVGQCTGTFASHKTKYDDGEANYKLPLFDHIGIAYQNYWLRNYYGSQAYYVSYDSNIRTNTVNGTCYLRPMIYIR